MELCKGDIVQCKITNRKMIVDDPDFYHDDCFCTWEDGEGKHRAAFLKSELIFIERRADV